MNLIQNIEQKRYDTHIRRRNLYKLKMIRNDSKMTEKLIKEFIKKIDNKSIKMHFIYNSKTNNYSSYLREI